MSFELAMTWDEQRHAYICECGEAIPYPRNRYPRHLLDAGDPTAMFREAVILHVQGAHDAQS